MNELTAPALKRKMDPLAMSNDSAMLRQLTAELNDPRLTGAVVPPEERLTPNTRAVTAARLRRCRRLFHPKFPSG